MATLNPGRRLELDSVLRCPTCGDAPYRVFRRQHMQADGTLLPSYESVLWPAGPRVDPPKHPERIDCPDCDTELRRAGR